MLAPMILVLGWQSARRHASHDRQHRRAVPMPWFVLGFLAMVGLNSVAPLSATMHAGAAQATTFLLAMALAAMGLETDFRKLKAKGLRPLALGAVSWGFISAFAAAMAFIAM
jgi:uncharacterized membrane protein YadS